MANRSIETLYKEFKSYLFEDFIPFMDEKVVDKQYGGFLCNTGRDGRNLNTNKRTWYDGRGIWVYSYLYKHIDQRAEYLEIARNTVDLVLKTKEAENELWPWEYDQFGNDLKTDDPDIYGNLFVAEGFAEYAAASGDDSYWQQAKDILMRCRVLYDHPDYLYKLQYSPISSITHVPRVLGHSMIMLRLSTSLLKQKDDPDIEAIAERCVDELLDKHYNTDFNLMIEVLDHDYSYINDELSQFVYIGHAIESLWMIMDEALRREDDELFNEAARRFKRHVEVAWDDVYGGVFHCIDHVDENRWLSDKVLWAQHEVLIGLLTILEKYPNDEWALHWFEKMYTYVVQTFPLADYGLPLWNIGGDRKVSFIKEGVRIENYHHPRFLMMGMQKLLQMQERKKFNQNNFCL